MEHFPPKAMDATQFHPNPFALQAPQGVENSNILDFYPDTADFDLTDLTGGDFVVDDVPATTNSEESEESAEGGRRGSVSVSVSELHEKRKEIDDDDSDNEVDESGKKRKESSARKPGRKLLTEQPTTVGQSLFLYI